MLGASLALFALLSAYVTFGSWPGGKADAQVNQVVLSQVAKARHAQKVAVRANAVAVAHRAVARGQSVRTRSGARAHTPALTRTRCTTCGPSMMPTR